MTEQTDRRNMKANNIKINEACFIHRHKSNYELQNSIIRQVRSTHQTLAIALVDNPRPINTYLYIYELIKNFFRIL